MSPEDVASTVIPEDPSGSIQATAVITPAPTPAPSSYSTANWPRATPWAGSASSSANPSLVSDTLAATGAERWRTFTSASATGAYSRPRASSVVVASSSREPTTTVFVLVSVRTTYSA